MWSVLVLLGGCSSVASNYQVTIVPKLLPDQEDDVLNEQPEVKLLVVPPEGQGDLEVWYAGTAARGTQLTLPDLPPVVAGTRIGLIFERPGLPPETWHRAETLAYGEVTVDEALATGKQEVTLEIVAPRVDEFARAGKLDGNDRKLAGALAVLPDGRGFVFGGGDPDDPTSETLPLAGITQIVSSDTILQITPDEDGWSNPTPSSHKLPDVTFMDLSSPPEKPKRAAMTATPVQTDLGWRILLAGGRYSYAFTGAATAHWCLWDPDSGSCDAKGEMTYARSSHLALPLGGNKVALYGGLINGGVGGFVNFEVFNVGTRKMQFADQSVDLNVSEDWDDDGQFDHFSGNFAAFGTSVGTDAIVCSGATSNGQWEAEPSSFCFRIEPNENVTQIEPLPSPIYGGSIAALPDGGVLVTGGTSENLNLTEQTRLETVPASDQAYRYDPQHDSWADIGPLVTPRAFHRTIALGDGRVMLIGGVEEVGLLYGATGEWIRCNEIFDPETNEFVIGECADSTAGQDPEVATNGKIWMTLQGVSFDGFVTDGGGAVGIMGAIPDVE